MLEVKIKLGDGAIMPTKATNGSMCYDLYSNTPTSFNGCGYALIPTEVFLELPEGYHAKVHGRSSLNKLGLIVPTGIIDNDYRGEIFISMWCINPNLVHHIDIGDRIAQLEICKNDECVFVLTNKLSSTDRGDNGFGSTGV